MDESFYLIPAVASPSMKKLQSENAQLKQELQVTKMKLSNAEKIIKSRQEQERMLRDSIISVKREVSGPDNSRPNTYSPYSKSRLNELYHLRLSMGDKPQRQSLSRSMHFRPYLRTRPTVPLPLRQRENPII
jgi:hypothetical protein